MPAVVKAEARIVINAATAYSVLLQVCYGDLTLERVDMIVNAANTVLDHACTVFFT